MWLGCGKHVLRVANRRALFTKFGLGSAKIRRGPTSVGLDSTTDISGGRARPHFGAFRPFRAGHQPNLDRLGQVWDVFGQHVEPRLSMQKDVFVGRFVRSGALPIVTQQESAGNAAKHDTEADPGTEPWKIPQPCRGVVSPDSESAKIRRRPFAAPVARAGAGANVAERGRVGPGGALAPPEAFCSQGRRTLGARGGRARRMRLLRTMLARSKCT